METSADRQDFLFRAAQSLSTSNDTNKLFANVVTLVRQLLKADRATLFIADREGKWVYQMIYEEMMNMVYCNGL